MKQLYCFCFALLAASSLLRAQPITLTAGNYGTLQPGDEIAWYYLDDDQIGIPEPGANRIWDYSTVPLSNSQFLTAAQANNPAFPNADIRIPTLYSFAGYNLSLDQYFNFSDQGHFRVGDSYAAATLAGPSAGDTLYLPAQDIPLPRTEVQFPATYGSFWSSPPVRYVINAELKASIFPKTPAQLVQNFMTTRDTVVGWGQLRLPGNIWLDVLLKKQLVVRVDSFYLAGIPAPSFILDQFGLKQGEVTREENYVFYAADLKGEAMSINLLTRGSASFKTVSFNSNAPTSVHEKNDPAVSRMYPDPAQSVGTLAFHKANGRPWSVVVRDILGREIFSRTIDAPEGDVQFPVDFGNAPAGLYIYGIYDDTGKRAAAGTVRVQ